MTRMLNQEMKRQIPLMRRRRFLVKKKKEMLKRRKKMVSRRALQVTAMKQTRMTLKMMSTEIPTIVTCCRLKKRARS